MQSMSGPGRACGWTGPRRCGELRRRGGQYVERRREHRCGRSSRAHLDKTNIVRIRREIHPTHWDNVALSARERRAWEIYSIFPVG